MPTGKNNSIHLVDLVIATLGSARSTRLFNSILHERRLKRHKKESVQTTLSRLQSKGYAQKSSSGWSITPKGRAYLKNKNNQKLLSYIKSPFSENQAHTMVLSFDIPEHSRVLRDWLRNQIKIFGYKMLQQSLWIGPSPLPPSFLKRLEDLGIRKNVKTFKITKASG